MSKDYSKFPEVLTPDGEILGPEFVEYSYTRKGRHEVGKEFPNPIPMEPPLGYVPSKPIHEQVRDMVMNELSRAAAEAGEETLEESEDFAVGDDFDPFSEWELEYEPTQPWFTSMEVEAAERRALASRAPPVPPAGDAAGGPPKPPEAPPRSDPSAGGSGAAPPTLKE